MASDPFLEEDFRVLTPEAFDFVLNNELKRAVRSQNFLTLLLVEPTPRRRRSACRRRQCVREVARLVSREVRETDLLSQTTDGQLSVVLLDADLQNSMQRHRSPDVAARALRVPHAARDRGRARPAARPTAPTRRRCAAPPRRARFTRAATIAATLRTLNRGCCDEDATCSVLSRVLLSTAAAAPAQTADGATAPVGTRRRRRASDGAGARPTTSARRLPAGARRQAAHRGLQGRAAVAVAAGPARRQDHAAARRRHRRRRAHVDRAARRDRRRR